MRLILIILVAIAVPLFIAYCYETVVMIDAEGLTISTMTYMQRVVFIFEKYGNSMVRGAGNSLLIAAIGTLGGCLIGFLCGLVQTIPSKRTDSLWKRILLIIVKFILNVYVEIFRGTPMMVQAMFIFYGIKLLFSINMNALAAGLIVVTINTGAYMAESVRGGILSVDPGQVEGAQSIGMNHFKTMLYVVLPQALRNIMPQIGNNFIINIKDSCVLSVISVVELFFASKSAAGVYYRYFEVYTITMVMYLIMTVSLSRLLRWVETRMDGPDSYALAASDPLVPTSGTLKKHAKRGDIRDGR